MSYLSHYIWFIKKKTCLWAGNKVLGEGGGEQAGQHLFHPRPELNVEQLPPGTGLRHTAWPTGIHDTLWQAGQDLIQLIWNYFTAHMNLANAFLTKICLNSYSAFLLNHVHLLHVCEAGLCMHTQQIGTVGIRYPLFELTTFFVIPMSFVLFYDY